MVSFQQPLVLIHGSGLASDSWDLVRRHLDGPSLALDLPGRRKHRDIPPHQCTITKAAECAERDIIDAGLHDFVLVAHSSAGVVAPAIIERLPDRVSHVVLVAATVPPHGGRRIDHVSSEQRRHFKALDTGMRYRQNPASIRSSLCRGLSEDQAQFVVDRSVPDSLSFMYESVDLSGYSRGIPCTYLLATRDTVVLPASQRRSAHNAGARVQELDATHLPMVECPDLLAEQLARFADCATWGY